MWLLTPFNITSAAVALLTAVSGGGGVLVSRRLGRWTAAALVSLVWAAVLTGLFMLADQCPLTVVVGPCSVRDLAAAALLGLMAVWSVALLALPLWSATGFVVQLGRRVLASVRERGSQDRPSGEEPTIKKGSSDE